MHQRGSMSLVAGILLLIPLIMLALLRSPTSPAAASTATRAAVTVTSSRIGTSALTLGVTHTQYTLDAGSVSNDHAAASVLDRTATLAAQHIMGWGTLSPEPSPGKFQWSTLDARVRLMSSTSAKPVLTLCCSPDWMKGGASGVTNWSDLEEAPLPSHYRDFANLAAAVALRYPQVHDFQVWNELKGFWDTGRNTWNIEAYTTLYNEVYAAVKRVRPDARIGGPYVPITSFSSRATASNPSAISGPWGIVDQRALTSIDYFLHHAIGADFIVVDGSSAARDGVLPTDPFSGNEKFAAVTKWIHTRTTLPVWWAEYYPQPPGQQWSENMQAAVHADALIQFATSGAAAVFLWQPNQDAASPSTRAALWTDVRAPGGGKPTPSATMFHDMRVVARTGSALYRVETSGPISALASSKGVLVVNRSGARLAVSVSGRTIGLKPYAVKVYPNR